MVDFDFNESTVMKLDADGSSFKMVLSDVYSSDGSVSVTFFSETVKTIKVDGVTKSSGLINYFPDGEVIYLEQQNNHLEFLIEWNDFQHKSHRSFKYEIFAEKSFLII